MDKELQHFLTHWFSGLINGLESVAAPARATILRACGQACAASYTAEVFQRAREQSADTEGFLARLAAEFPEATYTLLAPNTIRVCYTHCACDLVRRGWVQSPLLCGCSVYNLKENFERALGMPVEVTLERSILGGASRCVFLISQVENFFVIR
jgi:hypothetical protein